MFTFLNSFLVAVSPCPRPPSPDNYVAQLKCSWIDQTTQLSFPNSSWVFFTTLLEPLEVKETQLGTDVGRLFWTLRPHPWTSFVSVDLLMEHLHASGRTFLCGIHMN